MGSISAVWTAICLKEIDELQHKIELDALHGPAIGSYGRIPHVQHRQEDTRRVPHGILSGQKYQVFVLQERDADSCDGILVCSVTCGMTQEP